MIFITNNEKPLFYGYINGISEKILPNGSKITNYIIGTSELKNKEKKEYEYSSWFFTLMGNARKKCEEVPLKKGDKIAVTSFKATNVSKKLEDGSYSKPYLKMVISDYYNPDGISKVEEQTFLNSTSDDELPF